MNASAGWLMTTLMVTVRLAAATAAVPAFGPTRMPSVVRVGIAFVLAALLVAAMPSAIAVPGSMLQLAAAMGVELCLGAAFAAGLAAAYGAAELAGRVVDTQIGFGAAALLNPVTQGFSPLLGSFYSVLAVAFFMSMDGHLVLLRAIALSLHVIPPGSAFENDFAWAGLWRHFGSSFGFGLALAAPLMFMLLLSDIAMAILARSMPQLNVFVLGFAVKIVLGVAALAYSVQFLESVLGALFSTTFGYWQSLAS